MCNIKIAVEPYYNYNYCKIEVMYNQPSMIFQNENNWDISLNKSIYINQNFQMLQTHQPVISNKVLINPKFIGSAKVHINPTYIKTKGIFINPRILGMQSNIVQTPTYINPPKSTSEVLVSTKNKWVRKSSKTVTIPAINNNCTIPTYQSTPKNVKIPIKYTKYKIIRKDTSPKRKRRTSLILRYKLIRSNTNKPKSPQPHVTNNKFKLDRRKSFERIKSKLYFVNKAYRLKVDHKISILKRTTLKSIKMTPKRVVNNVHMNRDSVRMSRTLNISGRKYKMDNKKMVLRLAMTGGGNTLNRTVKVRKSDQIKIPLRKKLKTNNIPCPTYHRFGICQRHKRGMCQKVHNPDQIAVCSKFLQGVCHNDDCLLSHKISASKMATCKFYLDGLCTKDGCPYLHVKVNPKVAICKNFLSGFCQLGRECDKRHELLCPDFEQDGRCTKRNCQFPHKDDKRQSDNKLKVRNVKYSKVPDDKTCETVTSSSNTTNSSNKRYYEEENNKRTSVQLVSNSSNATIDRNISNVEKCVYNFDTASSSNVIVEKKYLEDDNLVKVDFKCTDSSLNDTVKKSVASGSTLYNRPRLGTLPTFIPF